jgi:hypothetical protein
VTALVNRTEDARKRSARRVKSALAAVAVASGIGLGWLAHGRFAAIGALAIVVAAANGYSKAYSP